MGAEARSLRKEKLHTRVEWLPNLAVMLPLLANALDQQN